MKLNSLRLSRLVLVIFILNSASNLANAQDLKAIENNWSDEDSKESEENEKTPAPIIIVDPIPPIKPQVITSIKKPVKILPITIMKPMVDPVYTKLSKLQDDDPDPIESYSWSESESYEEETTKKVVVVTPIPEVESSESEEIPEVRGPIKIPFVPKSGPKVEVGTVLKPGGFNGMKPVARPRQVQSIPYESWAESPLSMAPKKPKSGRK